MIEHIHGGSEQDAVITLAGTPADDFGQHGLAHTGIANEDEIRALEQEVQIQQLENPQSGLLGHPGRSPDPHFLAPL
jgi:hypothetical protein